MCDISSSICSSPIGHLLITYCPNGLHSVCQTSDITDKTFRVDENQAIQIVSSKGVDPVPESCLNWLETYFHSPDQLSRTPELCSEVMSKRNSFQEQVWDTLMKKVLFGQTITYGQLAKLTGSVRAARAVGTAMRCNPYQLIVPCHRVIRSNGVLGNYAGGIRNDTKRWLLEHERN